MKEGIFMRFKRHIAQVVAIVISILLTYLLFKWLLVDVFDAIEEDGYLFIFCLAHVIGVPVAVEYILFSIIVRIIFPKYDKYDYPSYSSFGASTVKFLDGVGDVLGTAADTLEKIDVQNRVENAYARGDNEGAKRIRQEYENNKALKNIEKNTRK